MQRRVERLRGRAAVAAGAGAAGSGGAQRRRGALPGCGAGDAATRSGWGRGCGENCIARCPGELFGASRVIILGSLDFSARRSNGMAGL